MTTVAQLTHQIRNRFVAGTQEALNRLASPLDAVSEVVECERDVTGIAPGSLVSIGLEHLHVWDVDVAAQTLTVERAVGGTTAASFPAGTLVRANPLVSDFMAMSAINQTLRALPAHGLVRYVTLTLTSSRTAQTYDLVGVPSNLLDVYAVSYDAPGTMNEWPLIRRWRLDRSADPSEFPSGVSLRLFGTEFDEGRTLRVVCRAGFDDVTSPATDLEADIGVPATAVDVVEIGAVMFLAHARPLKRTFTETQPDPRRAEEVPPGAPSSAVLLLERLFYRRLQQEAQRQARLYPLLRRM